MATTPPGTPPGGPPEFNVNPASAEHGGPANFSAMQNAMNAMAQSNVELNRSMVSLVESLTNAYEQAGRLREQTEARK